MSILIPGMEMPSGCAECKLNNDAVCALIRGCGYDESNGHNRRPDCPIIEIPPHGDLIDRDHLSVVCYTGTESLEDTFDNGVAWTLEYIDKLTPVIPAEEE